MTAKTVSENEARNMQNLSKGKFDFYIHKWVESVFQSGIPSRPSSLPPFSPVRAIVESQCVPRRLPSAFEAQNSFSSGAAEGTTTAAASTVISSVTTGTGIVYSTLMEEHQPSDSNEYELPARTGKTIEHLEVVGLLGCCTLLKAKKAKTKELRLVHAQRHIDYVDQISFFSSLEKLTSFSIGEDLYCSEGTSEAARMACGCVIEAARAVARNEVKNAYAIVRPPGHHASPEMASGFCFYNNVAVAARVAQEELYRLHPERYSTSKKPRVLILDWDVHHCNGTEDIFLEDQSVLVISIHQYAHGRGHVVRRRPRPSKSAAASEGQSSATELDVNELEQLILNDGQPLDSMPEDEQKESNSPLADPIPMHQDDRRLRDELGLLPRAKRARKEIDYNKLANELGVDDAVAAEVFGVPNALQSSSPSSSSSNTSSEQEDSKVDFQEGPRKLAADSESFSDEGEITDTQESFYPGTGHLKTIGGEMNEDARGRNINLACPTVGMGDLEYLQVIHEVVIPCGRELQPDIVFISCGFDSARGDLLGSMNLSCTGYYAMTSIIAKEFGAVVVALEGGYRVSNVARCSEAVLRALLESSGAFIPKKSKMLWFQMKETIENLKTEHRPYWKCFSA